MSFKEFIKPSFAKIIIFIILITLTAFIPKQQYNCAIDINQETSCYFVKMEGIGYPIFYGERIGDDIITKGFHPISFIINIVLYYLISSVFVYLFRKK